MYVSSKWVCIFAGLCDVRSMSIPETQTAVMEDERDNPRQGCKVEHKAPILTSACTSESPGGFIQWKLTVPHPRELWFNGVGCGLSIRIFTSPSSDSRGSQGWMLLMWRIRAVVQVQRRHSSTELVTDNDCICVCPGSLTLTFTGLVCLLSL